MRQNDYTILEHTLVSLSLLAQSELWVVLPSFNDPKQNFFSHLNSAAREAIHHHPFILFASLSCSRLQHYHLPTMMRLIYSYYRIRPECLISIFCDTNASLECFAKFHILKPCSCLSSCCFAAVRDWLVCLHVACIQKYT